MLLPFPTTITIQGHTHSPLFSPFARLCRHHILRHQVTPASVSRPPRSTQRRRHQLDPGRQQAAHLHLSFILRHTYTHAHPTKTKKKVIFSKRKIVLGAITKKSRKLYRVLCDDFCGCDGAIVIVVAKLLQCWNNCVKFTTYIIYSVIG